MNIVLWIIQIILCIKFISTAYSHGIRQDQENMALAITKMGKNSRYIHSIIAVMCVICSFGIVIPDIIGYYLIIVPITSMILAIGMLISIIFHMKYREKPIIIADAILSILAIIIAYGRWILIP